MSDDKSLHDGDVRVPLTDRVNSEPAILHGMTSTEASWIGGLSFLAYFMLTGLAILATGLWQLMLLPLIATIGTLWYGSMFLQKIKRDRPDGYYTHVLQLRLSQYALSRAHFMRHDGYWSVGRTHEISLTSPLSPEQDTPAAATASSLPSHEAHAPDAP